MPRLPLPGQARDDGSTALQRGVKWLTTNLLVAYLAAIAAQQVWVLLNSDVRELLKRMS